MGPQVSMESTTGLRTFDRASPSSCIRLFEALACSREVCAAKNSSPVARTLKIVALQECTQLLCVQVAQNRRTRRICHLMRPSLHLCHHIELGIESWWRAGPPRALLLYHGRGQLRVEGTGLLAGLPVLPQVRPIPSRLVGKAGWPPCGPS